MAHIARGRNLEGYAVMSMTTLLTARNHTEGPFDIIEKRTKVTNSKAAACGRRMMMAKRTINVTLEDRPDGGVRVSSEDLPGLILSGSNRVRVMADILPAATALLRHKGDDSEVVINATFVTPEVSKGDPA